MAALQFAKIRNISAPATPKLIVAHGLLKLHRSTNYNCNPSKVPIVCGKYFKCMLKSQRSGS